MMYEELIANLREHAEWANANVWVIPVTITDDLRKAADAIEELTDRNVGKWIPVTELLPEEHVFVLIRQDDDRMMVAERVDGDWWYRYFAYDVDRWDENEQGTITHWMPLPEPPEEK